MRKYLYPIIALIVFCCCGSQMDYNTMQKIDAHVHLETIDESFIKIARNNNFKLITLVTNYHSTIEKQFDYALNLHQKYPETISFATTFSMDGFGEPGWQEKTIAWLDSSFRAGAVGVKIWKDVGMTFRDKNGSFIMLDDPQFDSVVNFIESQNKTLVNHNGEPRNCWLSLDSMTVSADSIYFSKHPEYHMYLHSEYPSYDELNAARDRFLEKHPNLRYVGCHLASLEWNVDEIAKRFDKYPNLSVDMAERVVHLKIQDREKVRNFLIKYQDRLLYGTDIILDDETLKDKSASVFQEKVNDIWLGDWAYFSTDSVFSGSGSMKPYQGLKLPDTVLKKIYYENALRLYPDVK